METTFYGTYAVRKAAHGEQVIHIPKTVSGTFAVYVDDAGETVILRKQGGLDVGKLLEKCGE